MKHLFANLNILLIVTVILKGGSTQEASPCSELLQQGIYDKYSQESASSGFDQFISNFCGDYSTYTSNQGATGSTTSSSDTTSSTSSSGGGGSVGFSVFGLFGGSASGSGQQSNSHYSSNSGSSSQNAYSSEISALGQFLCNGTSSTDAANNALDVASEFIDPTAIDAYEQCLSQYTTGLQVSTTVREDQGQVTIQLVYVPPVGTAPEMKVTGIEISPVGSWKCSGPLWTLSQNLKSSSFGTESISMSCTRNVSNSPFTYQNQSLYAPSSSIIISTSSGTVIRNFIPIYAVPPEDAIEELAATLNSQILQVNSQLMSEISQLQTQISKVQQQIQITESGQVNRNFDDSNFALDSTSGYRTDCSAVQFQTSFLSPPSVYLALTEMDSTTVSNDIRLALYSQNITITGFTLCADTWATSAVNGYTASWLAYGFPASH